MSFVSRRSPAACSSHCRRLRSSCRSCSRLIPRRRLAWQGPTDSMFELSRTRNVIHIVLDAFQSDVFGEILAEERPKLDRSLSGAVFFANHTGAFPTTIASMPAMLTGKVYRNDRPLTAIRARHPEGGIDLQVSSGERLSRRCSVGHVSRQRIGDELRSSAAAVCELRRVHTVHRMAACGSVAVQARAAHTEACHSQRRIVAASSRVRPRRHAHAAAPLGQRRCRAG